MTTIILNTFLVSEGSASSIGTKKGPESRRNSGPWSFFIEILNQLHNGPGPTHKVSKPETELLIAVNHVFYF
jgi:hypothetical protein